MPWEVEYTDEFDGWFGGLGEEGPVTGSLSWGAKCAISRLISALDPERNVT